MTLDDAASTFERQLTICDTRPSFIAGAPSSETQYFPLHRL